ncbi:MAG: insulinase family protein, partial [Muribaculaceae bacterium]|nr:insulinase family protein [Muribaculaceae bacterium]
MAWAVSSGQLFRQLEINRFTLTNGLRAVHAPLSGTAMAAVDVLYRVGSRFENPELTGMAHLFEHLMFGGSANVADFDMELSRAGGTSNAWTSPDFTNFYNILPACNLDTALWLESDRMMAPALSGHSLEVQKQVVIEEFKETCLNRPYGDMDHALQSLAYKTHPYRYPVIGKEFGHIEKVTEQDVRSWHDTYYTASNAVVCICGNVSFDQARQAVERWFGDMPLRPVPPEPTVREPLPEAPRYREMSGKVPQTVLTMAYPMAAYGEPGYYAADLISDILANGQSSRFYRELLLGTDLFTSVDASIQGNEDPGLFLIQARLRHNGPAAEEAAIAAIGAQLDRMASERVEEHDLERCLNRIQSNRTFSTMTPLPIALTAAMAEMHGEHPDAFMEPYRLITSESLRASAATLFAPCRRLTLVY